MARPKKSEHDKRVLRLPHIRVTASELIRIEEQSTYAGTTISEYIRNLALTNRVPIVKNSIDRSTLVELNRVGVNIKKISEELSTDRKTEKSHLQEVVNNLISLMQKIDSQL